MSGQSTELVRLATMPRRGRSEAQDEFRISLDQFQGERGPSQYVSMRIWWRKQDEWCPGRQGLAVRKGELRQVIDALQRAERILEGKEAVRADPRQRQIPGSGRDQGDASEAF